MRRRQSHTLTICVHAVRVFADPKEVTQRERGRTATAAAKTTDEKRVQGKDFDGRQTLHKETEREITKREALLGGIIMF